MNNSKKYLYPFKDICNSEGVEEYAVQLDFPKEWGWGIQPDNPSSGTDILQNTTTQIPVNH